MNYPSIKTLMQGLDLDRNIAKQVRSIMESPEAKPEYGVAWNTVSRMGRIDSLIGTFGVEYQRKGSNAKSPAFEYCNTGDSYAATIIQLDNGRFMVGTWGDIVERGNYE